MASAVELVRRLPSPDMMIKRTGSALKLAHSKTELVKTLPFFKFLGLKVGCGNHLKYFLLMEKLRRGYIW